MRWDVEWSEVSLMGRVAEATPLHHSAAVCVDVCVCVCVLKTSACVCLHSYLLHCDSMCDTYPYV